MLRRLAIGAALAALAGSAMAEDMSQDFARCGVVREDRQRLTCYDSIRDRALAAYKASNSKGASRRQIALADLKTDMRDLVGTKVTTGGKLQVVGGLEIVFLKTDEMDMAPVTMKADGLPREDRKKLLNGCQVVLCKAVVTGTVRKSFTGQELVAESVSWF